MNAPTLCNLRELITNGLDDLEDYYLAVGVMERVRTGSEKVYTLDEVETHLTKKAR